MKSNGSDKPKYLMNRKAGMKPFTSSVLSFLVFFYLGGWVVESVFGEAVLSGGGGYLLIIVLVFLSIAAGTHLSKRWEKWSGVDPKLTSPPRWITSFWRLCVVVFSVSAPILIYAKLHKAAQTLTGNKPASVSGEPASSVNVPPLPKAFERSTSKSKNEEKEGAK
jgi:hypothetical protein